jgi:hypothetical protein
MLFTAVMMAFNAMAMERISSSADMTSLYLGEALTWQVQVQLDDVLTESTIVLPSFPSEFIELDRGVEILTQDGVRLSRHWVKLRPITLGGITLPSIEMLVGQGSEPHRTSPLFLEVLPRLSDEQMQAGLRDIKGPTVTPEPVPWLLWALPIAALLLVGLGWLGWRRRRHHEDVEPEIPPYDVAMAALLALDRLASEGSDLVQTRAFELTAIIKSYLEGRYAFNATDMTSEELLRHLRKGGGSATLDLAAVTPFIEETDAIKYAAVHASAAQANSLMERATDLVVSTKPDEDEAC